jgi:Flp pilus assembly pilin Flp
MQDLFLRLCTAAKQTLASCDGQSMTEYALTVSLLAFGCIAGEAAIASGVTQVFASMGATITSGVLR